MQKEMQLDGRKYILKGSSGNKVYFMFIAQFTPLI